MIISPNNVCQNCDCLSLRLASVQISLAGVPLERCFGCVVSDDDGDEVLDDLFNLVEVSACEYPSGNLCSSFAADLVGVHYVSRNVYWVVFVKVEDERSAHCEFDAPSVGCIESDCAKLSERFAIIKGDYLSKVLGGEVTCFDFHWFLFLCMFWD